MATASEISVGVLHELAITGCKVGFEPKDFAALAHSEEKMSLIFGYLRGTHEINPIGHGVNVGLTNIHHKPMDIVSLEIRGDTLYLDGKPLSLFLSKNQRKMNGSVRGPELREVLRNQHNVDDKVLDYLIDHPNLWPMSWRSSQECFERELVKVYFWGDIPSTPGDERPVRYGYWEERLGKGRVASGHRWVDREFGWHINEPALVFES